MIPQEQKEVGQEGKMSVDRIIELVRNVRDSLVDDFLVDENIQTYFLEQFGKQISNVKVEFLKRDLKELRKSAIDLSYYGSLIKQIQDLNSASLATSNKDLFHRELEYIFKKYNY